MRSMISGWTNWCVREVRQIVLVHNSGPSANSNSEPRPETISDPSRTQSEAEWTIDIEPTASLSPSPIRSQSPNPTLIRSRDRNRIRKTRMPFGLKTFFKYEERRKKKKDDDFVNKKDSWLADYYLEGNFWRFKSFIWISDVHSDLASKSSSDRES